MIMKTLKQYMDKGLSAVCIALFMAMTVIGAYQIITRYVFNAPSTVSEELLTFTFTWMSLLAAAFIFGKKDHMRMDFFAAKFTGKSSVILLIFSECLVLIFAALVLVYGGINITKLTMTQITASLGVPMSYVYVVIPISGVITIIYTIMNLTELTSQLKEY